MRHSDLGARVNLGAFTALCSLISHVVCLGRLVLRYGLPLNFEIFMTIPGVPLMAMIYL